MKARLFTALISVLFLCAAASAQGYVIRVAHNTNLRAASSLDARIVETVPAGATLNVVGSFNRWLRINYNGREGWMADWVGHTRVEEASQPAPATAQRQRQTTSIDNCCFVDRQCQSAQEWMKGYWAFQRNQCAAPAQSQARTAAQPVAAARANLDNCCFLNWQCKSDGEWSAGFYAYQANECKHPGIIIEGSPGFVERMYAALDMLRNGSAYWYDFVIRGLDRIRQTSREVMRVRVLGRTFELNYDDRPPPEVGFDSRTTHDASMLVHEACHVHRYEAGLEPGGVVGERACVETEIRALEDIAPTSSWIPGLRNVVANIERPECQWWWGEYRACW